MNPLLLRGLPSLACQVSAPAVFVCEYTASNPAIFQGTIDRVLQGLTGVVWYIYGILVSGRTDEEHLQHLSEVLA